MAVPLRPIYNLNRRPAPRITPEVFMLERNQYVIKEKVKILSAVQNSDFCQ